MGGAGRWGTDGEDCEGSGLGCVLGWGETGEEAVVTVVAAEWLSLRVPGIPGASLMGVLCPRDPPGPLGVGLARGNGLGGTGL